MKVVLVGDAHAARGFALAGVEVRACAPADLTREVARACRDPKAAVVLVAAGGQPFEVPAQLQPGRPPAVLALPEGAP